jgi:hypothetical protein
MVENPSGPRYGDTNEETVERLDIIDFSDAAGEWGSIVPIPEREANRMIELAEQRQIADLDSRRPLSDERHGHEVRAVKLAARWFKHWLTLPRSAIGDKLCSSARSFEIG